MYFKQRNKIKNPQKQLNEEKASNLPEKEFRVMIIRMTKDLIKRMDAWITKLQEMFNKELEDLKSKQTKMSDNI